MNHKELIISILSKIDNERFWKEQIRIIKKTVTFRDKLCIIKMI